MYRRAIAIAGLIVGVALTVSACSSSDGGSDSSRSTSGSRSSMSMSSGGSSDSAQFGAACSQIPMDPTNPGSLESMAKVPVATAASGNPLLSTLVTAVKAAGLVDTLNNAPNLTVFAPDNAAFAKLPKATLDKVLGDKALLTKILTYHVIGQRLTPAQVSGTLTTLEQEPIQASGSAPSITVGPTGSESHVVCGNIQTANATVYIVDTVMMPPGN